MKTEKIKLGERIHLRFTAYMLLCNRVDFDGSNGKHFNEILDQAVAEYVWGFGKKHGKT